MEIILKTYNVNFDEVFVIGCMFIFKNKELKNVRIARNRSKLPRSLPPSWLICSIKEENTDSINFFSEQNLLTQDNIDFLTKDFLEKSKNSTISFYSLNELNLFYKTFLEKYEEEIKSLPLDLGVNALRKLRI